MKHRIEDLLVALAVVALNPAFAQTPAAQPAQPADSAAMGAGAVSNVKIGRVLLGSGEPGDGSGPAYENATQVYNNLYHAPQYLPFYPTAATIWPRVIEVPCRQVGADLLCERYHWRPEYGRAEYLFFTPVLQTAATAPATPAAPRQ